MTKYPQYLFLAFLCSLFSLHVQAQVNVSLRINSGSSTTTCVDGGVFGSPPDPHFRVEVAGQGYTTYPSAGICFTDLPNTQYNETFDCPAYPSTLQVCLRALEDDGAICIIDESCLTQNCQNFTVPAPGNSATYNLSVAGSSTATINFTITTSGSFIGGPNDLICDAINLGFLPSGVAIGNASLSNYNNLCAGNASEPNPGWNDQGVWFTFTTSNTPSATIDINGHNDPAGVGDIIDMQLALYESSDGTCSGNMTLIQEDFDPIIYSETMTVECLLPNTTYYLLVDGDDNLANFFNGQEGYFGMSIEDNGVQQTPDLICDATDLGSVPDGGSVSTAPLSQSNICATDTNDPEPGAWGSDQGVWFQFNAPPSGHVIINGNSDAIFPIGVDAIDLQLAVYDSQDNTCTGTIVDVGSDYDPIILDEELEVRCLVAGDPYWLFVDGATINVQGIFDITITDGGDYPAPNDIICDATPMGTPITGNPVFLNLQNNYCANNILEPIPPWGNEQGVWYSFEAPNNGVVEIALEALGSDNIDLQVAVYDSDDMSCTGNLTEIGSSYSPILPITDPFDESMIVDCLEPGRTYYILVDGEAGFITPDWAEGEFDIEISTPDQAAPLGNDEVCDAIFIGDPTGGSVTTDQGTNPLSQNNFCADANNEPNPANWDPQQTVWYTFTAPSTGSVSIDVNQNGIVGQEAAIDLEIAVFQSDNMTCSGTLSEVEYDAGLFNWLTYDASVELTCLEPGETYYLVIDGEPGLIDDDLVEGYFDITLTEDPPQPVSPNDLICDAIAMGNPFLGSPLSLNDQNNLCADDDGDPDPDAFDTDQTVWYTFETPATGGPYAVEITATSDFPFFTDAVDLQIAVFSSSDNTCAGTMTEVISDYDAIDFPPLNETIEVQCLEPGNTYYVMIDGSSANVQGYFDIDITQIVANPIAPNDLICSAIDLGQVPIGGNINDGVDYGNFCADIESGEPDPSDFGIDQTVWFTFTTPPYTGAYATSDITIELESDPNNLGNEVDLQVAIYESSDGTCNGSFTEMGSEYGGAGIFLDEDISLTCLEPNTVYFVQIDGSNSNTEGFFSILINDDGQGSTPVNDDVCDNVVLGPVPAGGSINDGVTYNNFCASLEIGEPDPTEFSINNTVWFSFEAPSSGNATIDLNNEGGIDLQVGVYASTDQTCTGTLFEHDSEHDGAGIVFDESIGLTCLRPGHTYFVQVDGNYNGPILEGDQGDFSIQISDDGGTTSFPYNDSLCNAYNFGLITAATQTLTLEDNVCANIELGEPGFGGYAQQTVWYEFIAPTSGQAEIDLSANDIFGIDSEIYLFSSSNNACTGALSVIDMDYDATSLLDEEILTNCLIPGNTYYIQVDGTTVLGLDGEFTISISDPVPEYGTGAPGDPEPVNNDCADATTLPVQAESCLSGNGTWSLENYGQPTSADGSACGTGNCGDTWYQFVMPANGIVQVQGNDDAAGLGENGVLDFGDFSELVVTAYTGTCGGLNQINCQSGSGLSNSVDFEIVGTPGEIITLQVTNEDGEDEDDRFELCISEKCGADDCINGQVMEPNIPYCWDTQTAEGEDVTGGENGYLECGDNSNPDASIYFHFSSDCNGSSVTLSIIDANIGGTCLFGTTPTEGFNISLFEDDTPCDGSPLALVDCQSWSSCDGLPVNWSQTFTTLTPNTDYVLQIDAFGGIGTGDNNGFVMITTTTNPTLFAEETTPVSCFGLSDGTATATATSGEPPYTYEWDNSETTQTATMLGAGIHTVTVTANNGCTDTTSVLINEPTELLAAASEDSPASCNNASDGSATATGTGGTPTYTYEWDNNETTATATMLTGGTHTVSITDANNCTTTTEITISSPPAVIATVSADSPANCNGESNGTATAAGDGDPTTYTYEWDNNETTATATMLEAGVHVVTVTDQIGCTTTLSVTITEPDLLTPSAMANIAVTCQGQSDGTATASATGGIPPYTYEWDNNETTQMATALNAGTHTVTISDANTCTATTTINIIEPNLLVASTTLGSDVVCNSDSNGSATANQTGGTAPYFYDWDNNETTQTATALDAGIHTVVVTDTNGCAATATVDIPQPDLLVAEATLDNEPLCNGDSNGSATANQTGGLAPYSYEWDNTETTQTATALNAGIHTVTVTDANACSATATVDITQPNPLVVSAALDTEVLCNGDSNGSATANQTGGLAPYSYQWDNTETTQTASALNAGIHTVTVTDTNSCTATATVDITQPNPLVASAALDIEVLCNGDSNGSATANQTDGTAPYSYEWDNNETTQTATALDAGIHTVTVTDTNACTATATVNITQPNPLVASAALDTQVLCNGDSNGSATANQTDGTAPYSYEWDNNETTQMATALNAGIHTVTVTDANSCTATATVDLTQPDLLVASATLDTEVLCNGESNGSATANQTGGTAPYSYDWDNTETTQTATALNAGIHTVTITDANACTATTTVDITQPDLLVASASLDTEVICNGESNGAATANQTGGTAPYSYEWDNTETTQTATALSTGIHTVTITDTSACSTTATVNITQPASLLASANMDSPVACNGDSDGAATVVASGGIAPYSYDWDNNETTQTATGLNAGIHTVTVTDTNACSTTTTVDITAPALLLASATPNNSVTCNGDSDGSATASATGGVSPYSYEWDNTETSAIATALDEGIHNVTITDASNCTSFATVIISSPQILLASTIQNNGASCNGDSDGSATALGTGGTAPYTYDWDNTESTQTATALNAGIHSITITDANACSATATINVLQPDLLIASVSLDGEVLCNGESNGSATANQTGGTNPYSYEWDNTETTQTASALNEGIHTVTITDANACMSIATVNMTAPPVLSASTTINSLVLCYNESNGSATANPTGGIAPFTYGWDNTENTQIAVMLNSGTHTLTITDANDCTATASVVISEPDELLAAATPITQVSCAGLSDGSASVSSSGGTAPFTYTWSNTQTGQIATGLGAETHSVLVEDANGCQTTTTVQITAPDLLIASITVDNNVNCNGESNGTATANASGGTTPYTYEWDNTETTQTAIALDLGTHTVSVTDGEGCTTFSTVNITEPSLINAVVDNTTDASCTACSGTAAITVSGGTAPYTFDWTNSTTNEDAINLCAGLNSVLITDANACEFNLDVMIGSSSSLAVTSVDEAASISCNGICDAQASVTASGGTLPYSYEWDNGQTSATASNLCAGTHVVTVTDADNCIALGNILILEPALLVATSTTNQNVDCFGGNTGIVSANQTGGTNPFTYTWSNGGNTASISGLIAGNYQVTITDDNGCSATSSTTVTEPSLAVSVTINATANAGCTVCSGAATATGTGGTAPYTYTWSNGNNSPTPTDLCAGITSLTVTDANGCSTTDNINIQSNSSLMASTSIGQQISCNAACDGSAIVAASNGMPPYAYTWSNGETSTNATGLCTGTYTVTVTGADGCFVVNQVTLNQPDILQAAITVNDNISCAGESDGSATVSVSGGTSPYSYLWTNGGTDANNDNLAVGNHQVVISDANGCSTTANTTITSPAALVATVDATTDANCTACDGTANISVNGGLPPYVFNWNNSNSSEDPTNLCSGNNSVTVTDANACQFILPVSIGSVSTLVINSINETNSIDCNGECTAEATVNAGGGNPTYTYQWDDTNNQNTATATNLCAGSYNVTVTDTDGCIVVDNITIGEPDVLVASAMQTQAVSCTNGADGAATISPSGGTLPYTITWDNTETGTDATQLTAGNHSITVVDNNGCSIITMVTITEPVNLPSIAINGVTASGCTSCDGTASIAGNGGTAPYTYLWSNGETSENPSNLCVGPQSVTITDANGCTASMPVSVPSTGSLVLQSITPINATCNGDCDGEATASVNSGTPPYAYNWDDDNNQTTATASNLCAGIYNLTVADASGCLVFGTVTIGEPNPLTASIQITDNVSCNGASDGGLSVIPVGGSNSYTYEWSTGATVINPSGLPASDYSVTVTDSNNCTATASATLGEPALLIVNVSTTGNISCNGGNDGEASALPSGGTPPFTYTWSDGLGSNALATGMSAGTYTVTVSDASGCEENGSVTLVDPAALVLDVLTVDALCSGACTGEATASVSGGSGVYSYTWSTGGNGTTISNLCPTSYSLTVTDSEGCTIIGMAQIGQPIPIAISVETAMAPTCAGEDTGLIGISANGGSGNYTYAWNNGDTTAEISNLDPGSYTVTVWDDEACLAIETIVLNQVTAMTAMPMTEDPSCNGEASGSIVIDSDPSNIYSLDGVNFQMDSSFNQLPAGNYTVYVQNPAGCILTLNNIVIFDPAPILVDLEAVIQLQLGDSIQLDATSNTSEELTYVWTPAEQLSCAFCPDPFASPVETTTYLVQVSNAAGCEDSDEIIIEVDKTRNIFIPNAFTPNDDGVNDVFMIFSGGGVAQVNKLVVYDRWGELVFNAEGFQPNDNDFGWDGTFRGKKLNPAVFVYYAEIEFMDGVVVQYKGDVTLVK